jgi:hypothetical protein
MSTVYEVGLDKNGDGFICMDALPDDALNLIPNPVSYVGLPVEVSGGATVSLNWRESPYGTRVLFTAFPSGAQANILRVGRSGAAVNTIAVTPEATYSAGVWVRGVINAGVQPLTFRVYDQAHTELASHQSHISTGWTRFTVTFDAGAGSTHVYLVVEKAAEFVTMTADVAGFMLVAGETLPDGFNSGDPRDLDDFITSDVLAMNWRLGMARVYDHVSAPASGAITVRNEDGHYSPEISADALAPGTPVRIRARYDGQTYVLLSARIDRVEVEAGDLAGRTAVLHLTGPERLLMTARVLIPLLLNARANNVLTSVLQNSPLHRLERVLDTGESVFAYVGDTWVDGITALDAIRQIVTAERGRFFSDRHGHLIFRNRLWQKKIWTAAAIFADDFEALDYEYGGRLANRIRVMIQPREVGSAGSTIWRLTQAQRIPAGNCRRITARLRDSNDNPMGATDVIAPVASTDYTANTQPDGSGTNVTGQFSVTLGAVTGSAVSLDVCNNSAQTAYLMPGSRLRGTPLIQADPMLVEESDSASIDQHGLYAHGYNLPYFVTIDEANELAREQLLQRRHPFGAVQRMTVSSRAHPGDVLARTLFDVLGISEGRAGHSGDYTIVAEEHTVDLGGARHRVTWLLEALNPRGFWRLRHGALGQTTKLSYTLSQGG